VAGDVFSYHQDVHKQRQSTFEEYSREIVDITLDTESRATADVKVRNSTPVAVGNVVTDSDKKRLEDGERFKYVLEKESDGWKVAQVYQFSDTNILLKRDSWNKVFSAPTGRSSANVWVNQFVN
jgi:hypothetical protein